MPVLLALCAAAVAALAIAPLLYGSLLSVSVGAPGCAFWAVTGGLVTLLAGASIWQWRRHRRPREEELDRRLWEVLAKGERQSEADREGPSTR